MIPQSLGLGRKLRLDRWIRLCASAALLILSASPALARDASAFDLPATPAAHSEAVSEADPDPEFDFALLDAPPLWFPADVDSNSAAFWQGDTLVVFNSTGYGTYRSTGDSVESLSDPVLVQLPQPQRPGFVWIEAVWLDPVSSILYGWYHFEPSDLPCFTTPIIGAAASYDGGLSWEDRGFVIENAFPEDCDYDNGFISGGNGDFTVVLGPGAEYFYFLFSNYAGPLAGQGVGIARSRFEDRGQPGTVMKYYEGDWTEPGIDGEASALFASSTGWKGPFIESFWGPSVHWNGYINRFVALLNHTEGEDYSQEGVYITFSSDLIQWTEPQKLLDTPTWYPQVLGLHPGETDKSATDLMRLFLHGESDYVLQFTLRP